MDWLHCNNCFVPKSDGLPLLCTSCCHVLCEKCLHHICPICKKKFNTVQINESMPARVQYYFDDIPAAIARVQKAIKFQWEHRSRFELNKYTAISKFVALKKEKEKLKKAVALLVDDVQKETTIIRKIQSHIDQIKKFSQNRRQDKLLLASLSSTSYINEMSFDKNNSASNKSKPSTGTANTTWDTGYDTQPLKNLIFYDNNNDDNIIKKVLINM